YKSNLSHKLLGSYMDELLTKGMVEVVEIEGKKRKISKVVRITDKGAGFLAEFRRIRDFTEAFGL
ncbi:MAG: winged helix-turn-helix domain-containing protein, partial [Candidatus Woesearchaeota archaeon]